MVTGHFADFSGFDLDFVGHAWGRWRAQVGQRWSRPKATRREVLSESLNVTFLARKLISLSPGITRPAFVSCIIALIVEVPFCLFLSFWGIRSYAFHLSESEAVAEITQKNVEAIVLHFSYPYQLILLFPVH